ncbi:Guanosine-diphosphatase, partial [Cladochytrium tenue]
MDLGGGSTQIVFEPVSSDVILANNHRTEISFGGHHYALYQHSYLGYGLMEARRRLGEAAVAEADARRLRAAADASQPAASLAPTLPCLPAGATLADPSTSRPAGSAGRASEEHAGGAAGAVVRGTGAGFAACAQFVTRHLFDKSDAACTVAPCAWDGVHQPRLASAFPPGRDIYAFSYIYDRAVELGGAAEGDRDSGDGALVLTPDALRALGERVCSVDSVPAVPAAAAANDVAGGPAHLARAVSADPALCLDVGFIYHLLSTGYEIPGSRVLRTAKKIRGVETGWCLGAAIHMLDSMMAGSAGAKG